MPKTSLCRILTANVIEARYDVERFSLDWTKIKIGEIVHVIDTGHFYVIKDIEELDNENGYFQLDGGPGGSVSSVGLAMPVGFIVSNSPIVNTGTLTVTTTLSGVIKGNGSGFVPAIAGTDFENPLTFSNGVTRAANSVTVDTTLPLVRISSISTNGFLKVGSGNGTLAVDTNTYLTASTGVSSISGTSNEISASSAVGAVTLSLPSSLTFTGKTITGGTFNGGAFIGNASTATALQTGRAINGVNFNGTTDITITADAGTLTGATLNASVLNSSLTSLGTIDTLNATFANFGNFNAKDAIFSDPTAGGTTQIIIQDGDSTGLAGLGVLAFVDSASGSGGGIIHLGPFATPTGGGLSSGMLFYSGTSLSFSIGSTAKLRINSSSVTGFAKIVTLASSTSGAGINLPHGAAPTSPVDGDVWTTTAGLFVRINGVTKTVTLT